MRVFAVLAMIMVALVAGPAGAQDLTGTLKKINDSGEIVIGHRDASPPFSYVDSSKQPVGYSIDLCQRVAEEVRQKLSRPDIAIRYVALTAENRMEKVADGSIDIECGVTTNTLSRREKVDFSSMIFITGASFLLRANSSIQGPADLAGKRISVVQGTTTEKELGDRLQKALIQATIVPVTDHDVAMKMLAKGEVDAHAGDQIVLIGLLKNAKDPKQFALAAEVFTYEPYALVVRRDDADFRLVVDRALAELYRSGQIASIYDKWFGDWGGKPSKLLLAMYALNGFPE